MHRPNEKRMPTLKSNRSAKSSLSPYCIEDIALTAADIRRLRDDDRGPTACP